MLLKPMRYKDYTWPHNPESCAVEYRRQIAAHKIPLGGWYLQDLGRTYRIFRGEGTFAGERAYEEFQTLAEVFDQTGPGLLVHPVWRTVSAYFVTLELMEEPLPDYVRYRFAFCEAGSEGAALKEVSTSAAGGSAAGLKRASDVHLLSWKTVKSSGQSTDTTISFFSAAYTIPLMACATVSKRRPGFLSNWITPVSSREVFTRA